MNRDSSEERHELLNRFHAGCRYSDAGELQQAHDYLAACLVVEPENLVFADHFLVNLQRLAAEARPVSWWRRWAMGNHATPGSLQEAVSWLRWQPHNAAALWLLAKTAWEQDAPEVTRRLLAFACADSTDHVEALQLYREVLIHFAELDEALAVVERLLELLPGDPELVQQASSLRILIEPDAGATPLAEQPDALLEQLAEHRQHQRHAASVAVLQRLTEIEPGNADYQEWCEDAEIDWAQRRAERAAARFAETRSEFDGLLQRILQEHGNAVALDILRGRAEKYPQESDLHRRLAQQLMRSGQYSAAEPYLARLAQPTVEDLRDRAECLQRLYQFDAALQVYLQAWEQAQQGADAELQREIQARGCRLAEAMQRADVVQQLANSAEPGQQG